MRAKMILDWDPVINHGVASSRSPENPRRLTCSPEGLCGNGAGAAGA